MMALRALRLLLPTLIIALLVCLPYRLRDGGTPRLDVGPLSAQFGVVNVILLTYIAALTWLLARYSSTNLRGQHRLDRFGALFVAMTVSLLVLVSAGNLPTLAVAWTASGVLLGCLVSHTGTATARAAARRVQAAMGTSSLLLWAAVVVAAMTGLSLDGTDTTAALSSTSATLVAALMLVAGVLRSALAPFHRWLPETAEAPSPVSALLHAGVVNAAGVVAVLQWDLLSAQPALLVALAIIGLATVVWCSLEQRVRPDVKGRLAASTSAQMGWMALQVGVGAPAAALLHLMGHGAWKAWLFLRAGGAVVRSRRETPRPRIAWARAWPASLLPLGLALTPVSALVALTLLGRWDNVSASALHVLLLGVSILVAAAVGVEAAALERSRPLLRGLVAASGGLAIAAYLIGAVAWEQQLTDRAGLAHPAYAGGVALAGATVVAVALLGWVGVRLQPGSHHPIATLVSSTSLPPRSRLTTHPDRSSRAPGARTSTSPGRSDSDDHEPSEVSVVRETVELAGKLMGPAWPLRATVAVNPLSGLEILPFDTALSLAERFHQASLRPSFSWFLGLYDQDRISDQALAQAMDHHGLGGGPRGVAGLVDLTREIRNQPDHGHGTRPVDADESAATEAAVAHAHLWSARAWHRTEDRSADLHGPWLLWKRSAEHPIYGFVTHRRDAHAFARSLPEDPAHAILDLLERAGHPHADLFETVTSVLAAGPGWVAHAQWRARRSGSVSPLVELVALRLAHTVLHGGPLPADPQAVSAEVEGSMSFQVLQKIWLDALDHTTQDRLCRPLAER
ncbi:MAG: putative inorganic carbon transporter subunit DabA, partial [Mycobacteriales bacterium]